MISGEVNSHCSCLLHLGVTRDQLHTGEGAGGDVFLEDSNTGAHLDDELSELVILVDLDIKRV